MKVVQVIRISWKKAVLIWVTKRKRNKNRRKIKNFLKLSKKNSFNLGDKLPF